MRNLLCKMMHKNQTRLLTQRFNVVSSTSNPIIKWVLALINLASYPGSHRGGRKKEPGTDHLRMRLIYQHSGNAVYHLDTFRKLRKRDVIKSVCRVKFTAFAIDIRNCKRLHVRTYVRTNAVTSQTTKF